MLRTQSSLVGALLVARPVQKQIIKISRILLLLLPISVASASASTYFISDTTFSPSNWEVNLTSTTVPGVTATFTQVSTGGNPGSFGRIDYQTPAAGNFDMAVLYKTQTYSPAVQGAIDSFTISADLKGLPYGASLFLILKQGDSPNAYQNYFSPSGPFDLSSSWTHVSVSGGSDLAGANLLDGSPIEFGLYVSYYTTGYQIPYAFGVDNFQVAITPVPEPAGILPAGLALWLLLKRVKRGRSL